MAQVEHYFQAMKYADQPKVFEDLRTQASAPACKVARQPAVRAVLCRITSTEYSTAVCSQKRNSHWRKHAPPIDRGKWEARKVAAMTDAIRAKFSQNAGLRAELLKTGAHLFDTLGGLKPALCGHWRAGNRDIREAGSRGEKFWCGTPGAQNMLGKIIVRVRDELRASVGSAGAGAGAGAGSSSVGSGSGSGGGGDSKLGAGAAAAAAAVGSNAEGKAEPPAARRRVLDEDEILLLSGDDEDLPPGAPPRKRMRLAEDMEPVPRAAPSSPAAAASKSDSAGSAGVGAGAGGDAKSSGGGVAKKRKREA